MAFTSKNFAARRAINFDLDIEALKENYSVNNPKGAYKEIRSFLEKNGFFHRQGSGYCSKEQLTDMELLDVTEKMFKAFPWLDSCSRRIDATDIGEIYDLKERNRKDGLRTLSQKRSEIGKCTSKDSILQKLKSNINVIQNTTTEDQKDIERRDYRSIR